MSDLPTVLIVEDEPDLLFLFEAYLEGSYDVRTASSGEEALDRLTDEVEVVLLDRNLPGSMMGRDVLEAITDRGEFMVAMITAIEPDFGIIDMEVDDYLTKPVSRDELNGVVQQLLARRDYEGQLAEYFSLAQKRAALMDEKSPPELDQHEEFRRLETRLLELRDELDDIRSRIRDEDEFAVFNEPETGESADPGPGSDRGT